MTELWIPITVGAAFLQFLRTALQKELRATLSTNGATFVRFFYGLPLTVAAWGLLQRYFDHPPLDLSAPFFVYCAVAGLAQIFATALLIRLFSMRNFAIATTYSKTESVQTAAFGLLLLGDPVSLGGVGAIVLSVVGVGVLSIAHRPPDTPSSATPFTPVAVGLGSGAFFAIAIVCVRAAAIDLGPSHFLLRASTTLMTMTLMQSLALGIYLALREPGQWSKILSTWRRSALVGATGVLGSAGWFTAVTIHNAAYVRTLGQVELVFSFIATHLWFRERTTPLEVAGVVLVIGGIVMLLSST